MDELNERKRRENEGLLHHPASARAKLDRESGNVKGAILGLIKAGRFDGARLVLRGYVSANPSDGEAAGIGELLELAASEAAKGETKLKDKMALLDGIETIFILENAFSMRNGAVSSVFRKARLMWERWGYGSLILTCGYDPELRRFCLGLRRDGRGRLPSGVRVMSVYDYLQGSYADGLELKTRYHPDGKGAADTRADGGGLVRKDRYGGVDGALSLTEEFRNGVKTKEIVYDDWGYVSSARQGDETVFYAAGGFDGAARIKALHGADGLVTKLTLYGEDGSAREFRDNAGLAAHVLERIMSPDKFYELIFESGIMGGGAGLIKAKNAAKAAVAHSVFLKDPYDLNSEPQAYARYLCDGRGEFDSIVFLTETERADFLAKYGETENAAVIPHPYPYPIIRSGFGARDHRKAVTVARLDALKRVGLAIDIFAAALKKLPDIRFEIYGFGEKEEELKERIKALGIGGNVFMMGLTDDPAPIFSSSALYMTASAAEGFPLTLVESVCSGCPVFSFDIKYGPSDIIEDGKTGFLIPRGGAGAYASKLVDYFEDIELQRTMSENCYASAERFGADKFLESWYELAKRLYTIKHNIFCS